MSYAPFPGEAADLTWEKDRTLLPAGEAPRADKVEEHRAGDHPEFW